MSGGSSKSSSSSTKTAEPEVKMSSVPAFMPGFDSMIAQQLGMGGYGDPSTLLAQMQAIQSPLQIPSFGYSPSNPATPSTSTSGARRNPKAPRHEPRPHPRDR